jgi:hypothetical protein
VASSRRSSAAGIPSKLLVFPDEEPSIALGQNATAFHDVLNPQNPLFLDLSLL